jgi:nucleotide-binding universal stress UspA family protein
MEGAMTAVEMISREMEHHSFSPGKKAKSIVIATDASTAAEAAFKAAILIGEKTETIVHVVSVLEPMPVMFPAGEGLIIGPELEESREEAQRAIITDQMNSFDEAREWNLEIRTGRATESIVDFAQEYHADLIIIGLNKHGIVGRMLGEETAMGIARYSDIPLLIAAPSMTRLPRRILVAMDLNPDGLQLAPEVLSMIADTPSISCVHVKPRSEFLGIDWADYDNEYELAMRERFKTLENALEKFNIRPDLIPLHGDIGRELSDFATYSKAELIVAGVRRRRGRARAVSGRIAARIIRHADCSVLIVPNLVPRTMLSDGETDVIRDSQKWSAALREFTARNAGRVVNLEVDDPEIGALVEASRYPFLGADYDHKDGRLTLTLGYTKGLDRHLSRTIAGPESVSILRVKGRDAALSVAHAGGQTLLNFEN